MNKNNITIYILIIIALFISPSMAAAQNYSYLPADFQQKIASLSSTPVTSLPMTVLFGVGLKDISPNFGVPRATRKHQGEDIMAVKDTPVVSPTEAVVLGTQYGATSGNMVYTINPGGETFYYIHLDRFGEGVVPGELLEPGSLIGYVGNTGDAAGGAAHLHFEIHNSSDVAINPFPLLTKEFTPEQKISFLAVILKQTSDPAALSQFLVKNFSSELNTDVASNIILPSSATGALSGALTSTTSVPVSNNLDLGSSGADVVVLQKYLIQANSGIKAKSLSKFGATGYFGAVTKSALIEYQAAAGISPSSGYYGSITQAFIKAHPLSTTKMVAGSSTIAITRELYQGVSGEDVRALQKLLNANGYTIKSTGLGSLGNETTYFGSSTKAAVIKFQIAKKISPAEGNVGPLTRAALTSL